MAQRQNWRYSYNCPTLMVPQSAHHLFPGFAMQSAGPNASVNRILRVLLLVSSGFTARVTRSVTPDVFRLSLQYDMWLAMSCQPCYHVSTLWQIQYRCYLVRGARILDPRCLGLQALFAQPWSWFNLTDSRLLHIACGIEYETGLWTLAARTAPGPPMVSPSPYAPLATRVRYTMNPGLSSPSPLIL